MQISRRVGAQTSCVQFAVDKLFGKRNIQESPLLARDSNSTEIGIKISNWIGKIIMRRRTVVRDVLIECNGQVATMFPTKVQNSCDNDTLTNGAK